MSGLPQRLQALLHSQAYPDPVQSVELVETHISWVLLTGTWAYKIKRPVRYSFVDLRSLEHRAFLCQEEVRLNRRFAPDLYDSVCPVTAVKGDVRMGGVGTAIEHAVRMRQFRREDELDRLLDLGRIELRELEGFGRNLATIHRQLPSVVPGNERGEPGAIRAVVLDNHAQCVRAAKVFADVADVRALRAPLAARLGALASLMLDRRAASLVKECHGDLHCRNIVRCGVDLIAFDCLEFEPAFRWIDVADEISLLLADLHSRHRPQHSLAFLNGYLSQGGDYQACRLLDCYQAHRALVRAKVIALEGKAAARAGIDVTGKQRRFADYFVEVCSRHAGRRLYHNRRCNLHFPPGPDALSPLRSRSGHPGMSGAVRRAGEGASVAGCRAIARWTRSIGGGRVGSDLAGTACRADYR